ncbi:MAG: methyltransferase domain-containing protein [Betaproteobacteria bacterium]|nr:methyltransferase domain-containing protein [Betaproteobacteria bacterium]
MNRLIKRFDSSKDEDLRLCMHRGIAYQRDMGAAPIAYDDAYHDHYQKLEGSSVAASLNAGRCAMLARHAPAESSVLDIGAGCGTFVRAARSWGFQAKGFDIIPKTVAHLKSIGAFADNPDGFDVVTFWDSLEHIEEPEMVLKRVNRGCVVLAAIPIFEDLTRIRESKHYKPGEHLYYFTRKGFVDWMALYGFRLLEESAHETDAGRDSIGAFAFRRDLPDYHDHIAAYSEMHSTRFYGSSATELHLQTVAGVVRDLKPCSILDWGCGRSDLVAHFWADGARRIERYDPAIPAFKQAPAVRFDLVLCCDVLEHIPMASVDRVLDEVREKGPRAVFTISTKLARAKLPDGRNAHVTLLTRDEWKRWVADYYGAVRELPSQFEHELILLAGPK